MPEFIVRKTKENGRAHRIENAEIGYNAPMKL